MASAPLHSFLDHTPPSPIRGDGAGSALRHTRSFSRLLFGKGSKGHSKERGGNNHSQTQSLNESNYVMKPRLPVQESRVAPKRADRSKPSHSHTRSAFSIGALSTAVLHSHSHSTPPPQSRPPSPAKSAKSASTKMNRAARIFSLSQKQVPQTTACAAGPNRPPTRPAYNILSESNDPFLDSESPTKAIAQHRHEYRHRLPRIELVTTSHKRGDSSDSVGSTDGLLTPEDEVIHPVLFDLGASKGHKLVRGGRAGNQKPPLPAAAPPVDLSPAKRTVPLYQHQRYLSSHSQPSTPKEKKSFGQSQSVDLGFGLGSHPATTTPSPNRSQVRLGNGMSTTPPQKTPSPLRPSIKHSASYPHPQKVPIDVSPPISAIADSFPHPPPLQAALLAQRAKYDLLAAQFQEQKERIRQLEEEARGRERELDGLKWLIVHGIGGPSDKVEDGEEKMEKWVKRSRSLPLLLAAAGLEVDENVETTGNHHTPAPPSAGLGIVGVPQLGKSPGLRTRTLSDIEEGDTPTLLVDYVIDPIPAPPPSAPASSERFKPKRSHTVENLNLLRRDLKELVTTL